jgi:hypothetical protein
LLSDFQKLEIPTFYLIKVHAVCTVVILSMSGGPDSGGCWGSILAAQTRLHTVEKHRWFFGWVLNFHFWIGGKQGIN